MTDALFELVASHGVLIVTVITFLSCLAMPVPSSFVMLAAGAFVASGDLVGWQVISGALGGAVLGDQTGYELGRRGGAPLLARLNRAPARARILRRARGLLDRWGGGAVFLTRWAMSPLGPYVNPMAGALGMSRPRFATYAIAGEVVWVSLYVGLGFLFGANLNQIAELVGSAVGLLTAGGITLLLGALLWERRKNGRHRNARQGAGRRHKPPQT
jgi:membrane-associated protein